jgi:hypothetical protein
MEASDESQLLQLPGTALSLVLQQLDTCSLACTAVTYSKLSYAVPAAISKLAARCTSPEALQRFIYWLEGHSTRLKSPAECSLISTAAPSIRRLPLGTWPLVTHLPCSQLRQLQLRNLHLQFEPAGGSPGLLHHCTGLTVLDLSQCVVTDVQAAFAAVAALPQLQRLCWSLVLEAGSGEYCLRSRLADLQHPLKLKQLSIDCSCWYDEASCGTSGGTRRYCSVKQMV